MKLFLFISLIFFLSFSTSASMKEAYKAKENGNWERAFSLFLAEAEAGNRKAQSRVGLMYYYGKGTKKNKRLSRKWLKKAAYQGSPSAHKNLKKWFPTVKIETKRFPSETLKKQKLIAAQRKKEELKRNEQKQKENQEAALVGAAIGVAAVGGLLYWMFSDGDSSSTSTSTSYSSSKQKYGCKFYCTGQFGNSRSSEYQVNTPATNLTDAQEFVREQYKSTCKQYPFYSGGGGTASVGFPNCETYYYK